MTLLFAAETHTYTVDGIVRPSVTEIMAPLYDWSRVPLDVLETARERGVAVHRALELLDRNELDENSVDPRIDGYIDAYLNFVASRGAIEWILIECPLYHRTLGYAGTPDRYGYVDGMLTVLDFKTTATMMPQFSVQLSGYTSLISSTHEPPKQAMCLRLLRNGTFELKIESPVAALPIFMSCLTLYKWRKANACIN